MNDKSKMKVYYNSACPVCKAGIEGQMDTVDLKICWGSLRSPPTCVL